MTDVMEGTSPAERVRELAERLKGEPDRADLAEASQWLLYMLHELGNLETLLARTGDCLIIEEARHVSFDVDKRGGAAQVRVDDAVRLVISHARQIEFTYELAAARSTDKMSYTIPPMRWADPE